MSGHRKWSTIRVPNDDRERQSLVEQKLVSPMCCYPSFRCVSDVASRRKSWGRIWDTSQPNVSKMERPATSLFQPSAAN